MSQIVLTDEQVQAVEQAKGPVMVIDSRGNAYTSIRLELTAERIAELKRRAAEPGPRYTGDQIQAMFRALEAEWERTGGFDEEYAREFVRRMDSAREAG
jgi:chorismate mutase